MQMSLSTIAAAMRLRPSVHLNAAHNVERVRSYMEGHLGCTAKEIAYALSLSPDQARRAVVKIRSEWVGKC